MPDTLDLALQEAVLALQLVVVRLEPAHLFLVAREVRARALRALLHLFEVP